MKVVLSPAKSLNFEETPPTKDYTQGVLNHEAEKLMKVLKKKTPKKLKDLMSISNQLAELNYERNQVWETPFSLDNAKQAIFTFTGDVYVGFEAESISDKALSFAQKHLRILSGLYGILKPLDLIQPYRLEMGTPLKTSRGDNLYQFWKDRITDVLNKELTEEENPIVLNLASNEYFKSLNTKKLKGKVVEVDFKDFKNGKYKVISFFAKRARGAMARFICDHQIEKIDDLEAFDWEGYQISKDHSTEKKLTFLRNQE